MYFSFRNHGCWCFLLLGCLAWAIVPRQAIAQCGGLADCPTSDLPFSLPDSTTEIGPNAFQLGPFPGGCYATTGRVLAATGSRVVTSGISIESVILFTDAPAIEVLSGGVVTPHVMSGSVVHAGGSVCIPSIAESAMITDRAIGVVAAGSLSEQLFPGPPADPECATCRGDMDGNGVIDSGDLSGFVATLLSATPDHCADLNADGSVNGLDIQPMLDRVIAGGANGTSCSSVPISAAGTAACTGCNNIFTLCVETYNAITGVTTLVCESGLGDFQTVIPAPVVPGVRPDSYTNGPISGTLVYTATTVYNQSAGVLAAIPLTTGSYVSHAPGGGGVIVTTTGGMETITLPSGAIVMPYADCSASMAACGTPATIAFNVAPCVDVHGTAADWGPVPGILCEKGACCLSDGVCEENVAPGCCESRGGTYLGAASECAPLEACCFPNGSCQDLDPRCCLAIGGSPDGPGTCFPEQACCLPDGTCIMAEPFCCTDAPLNGMPQGVGTTCNVTGACCLPGDACIVTTQQCCLNAGGFYQGNGFACVVQACCFPDGTCRDLDAVCCVRAGGAVGGAGTACAPAVKCCLPDGTCENLAPDCCTLRMGQTFAGMQCGMPTKCCLPDGSCRDLDPDCCNDLGGDSVNGQVCGAPVRCCLPSGMCIETDRECCVNVMGSPAGPGSLCELPPSKCCLTDGACIETDPDCCTFAGGVSYAGQTCDLPQACCLPDGSCRELDPDCCLGLNGAALGVGTTCPTPEACCLPDGACIFSAPQCCTLIGGTPQGPFSLCTGVQKCCLPGGACIDADPLCCTQQGGTSLGAGTTCQQPEKCCLPDGTCLETDPACCAAAGGISLGAGAVCLPPQKCCYESGDCIDIDPECCFLSDGFPIGPGTMCLPPEACCLPDMSCIVTDPECCGNMLGQPLGPGSTCMPPEKCCFGNGMCVEASPACCIVANGIPGGPGSFCLPVEACCFPDGGCEVIDPECCLILGAQPRGPGSSCPPQPPCGQDI